MKWIRIFKLWSHNHLNRRILAVITLVLLLLCLMLLDKERSLFTLFSTYLPPSKSIEENVPHMSQVLEPGVIIQVNAGDQSIDWDDGKCTLPEAILSANQSLPERPIVSGECLNGQGSDTIIFGDVSTVKLTTPYELDPDYGLLSLPPITSTVTISGGIEGVIIKRAFDTTEPIRILQIEGVTGRLTLENITIEGGNLITEERSLNSYELGSSIMLYNQAVLTLTKNSLITGTKGGGIYATHNSSVSLIDSVISNGTGSGVKLEDHSHVRLFHSTIANMVSTSGGGISASDYSTVELIDSYVALNIAGSGGGIYTDSLGNMVLKNSDIISNIVKGGVGGGIVTSSSGLQDDELYRRGHVTIENSRIAYNKCEEAPVRRAGVRGPRNGIGSGLVTGGRVTIINSQISYNSCIYPSLTGSGISFGDGNLIVENSQILRNTGGAGITVNHDANARILDNTYISENRSGIWNMGHMTIIDSYILSNTFGGVFSQGELSICNSSIISNTSTKGAGVRIKGLPYSVSIARFVNTRISHNRVVYSLREVYRTDIGSGGGIYSERAFITIKNSELTYNSAVDSENITTTSAKGGAISAMEGSQIRISHSNIAHNEASFQGGGIFVADGGNVILNNNRLFQNEAEEGSVIQNMGGQVVMRNNIIIDNSETAITGTSPIMATHNWWGQADGPSGVGSGSGDLVGVGVDFSDFYTQPIAIDNVDFPCEEDKLFLPWVER